MKTNKAFSSKRFKATKFMTKSLIQTEDYLIILISKNEIYIIIIKMEIDEWINQKVH